MKYSLLSLSFALILSTALMAQNNQLTEQEKAGGWQLLFNGKTTEHWKAYNSDAFPDQGWTIEDGVLVFRPVENSNMNRDIVTRDKFSDFEFKIEWMIEEGGNSGIFYHALEQPDQPIYWSAPEMQILDNENHPDANQGENGNRKAGSLYDLIPADPQNTNPHSEWNSVRIVSKGPHIEHWQNGEKVLEYDRWTPKWYQMIRNSKFATHPEFGDIKEGRLGLQDHGNVVKFRNIKIREL